MRINENKVFMSQEELDKINEITIILAAAGIDSSNWQTFGFEKDLANTSVVLATLVAYAEKTESGEYVYDLEKDIYGSEHEPLFGFPVGDCSCIPDPPVDYYNEDWDDCAPADEVFGAEY